MSDEKNNEAESASQAPESQNRFKRIIQQMKKTWFGRQVVELGPLLIAIIFIRYSLASTYQVPTGSMLPTIFLGDRFFGFQAAYGFRVPCPTTTPEEDGTFTNFFGIHMTLPIADCFLSSPKLPARGDIIVFISPKDPTINLVKRAVAIEDDTIEVYDGRIILNGKPLLVEPQKDFPADGMDHFIETLGDVRHQVQFDRLDSFDERERPFHAEQRLRFMPPRKIPKGHFFAMGDNRDHSGDSRIFGPVDAKLLRGKAVRFFFSMDPEWTFPFFRFDRFFASMYKNF